MAAALVCGTWGYFYLQDLKKPTLKPLSLLPDSCSILIEVKQPKWVMGQLTQGNLIWEELLRIKDVRQFNATMSLLDSLTQGGETQEYLGQEPLYIAVYGGGAKQNVVYAFNVSDVNETDRALGFFEKQFGAKKLAAGLYQCTFAEEGRADFFIYTEAGLFLASKNRAFLEQIAAQNHTGTINSNRYFSEAYKTIARDKGISVFAHLPHFTAHNWQDLFGKDASRYFSDKNEKWIPADISAEPSDFTMQGFLPADSSKITLLMRNQSPGDVKDILERLPYNTFAFEALSVSDYAMFCRDSYGGDKEARKGDLKKYSDSLAADAQTEIIDFIGSFVARCKTWQGDTVFEYGIVGLDDEEKAARFLGAVADSSTGKEDAAVFYFKDKQVFPLLSAHFMEQAYAYVAVVNECAVLCHSKRELAAFKRSFSDKQNMLDNERAMHFLDKNFNPEVNYLYYADVFRDQRAILDFLSPGVREKIPAGLLENFDAIAFSMQRHKDGLLYKAHTGFNHKNKMYRNTLWEMLADTDLYKTPVPLVNHRSGEKELACQDMANNLYLLSNTGKQLWKKNIGERVLGDPVQIDFFANGKLQMLFVTESSIHLLDRNGNYVDGFPVKIKAGASGPVTVFDYERARNYRLWLPLKNNTVVCLNAQCKLVDGFVPVQLKAPLSRQVEHLVLQQKDYFVLCDTLGHVYTVNRKGVGRGTITGRLPQGRPPVYLEAGRDPAKTYLCYVDLGSKRLHKLALNDRKEEVALPAGEAPRGYCFDAQQEDGKPAVLVMGAEEAALYDFFGRRIQQVKLPSATTAHGCVFSYGARKVFAALEDEGGSLLLVDMKTGEVLPNEMKLSALPASYPLIRNRDNYLVGYYRSKIFCLRP